jgi:dTDP-4-dehydrorhamnose 3,5-epimerase
MSDSASRHHLFPSSLSNSAPSFQLCATSCEDLLLIQRNNYEDVRGSFGKLYSSVLFDQIGVPMVSFNETIYSISAKDVIRGMHYQESPFSCAKLVSVVKGSIIDVVVCIDPNHKSSRFGQSYSCLLSASNSRSLFIPEGYAHGFRSLEEETIVVYNQSENYSREHDKGINYLSFGFDWNIADPIVSEKDQCLPSLSDL